MLAGVAVLSVSACGSTVQLGAGTSNAQGALNDAGLGLGLDGTTSQQPNDSSAANALSSTPSTSPEATSSTDAAIADAVDGSSGNESPSAATPTVLPASKPIKIGVIYNKGADAALGSLAPDASISFGNQEAQFDLITADLNAHGGIAGRKVQLIKVPQDTSDTSDFATQQQKWCTALTEDNKADAVLSIVGYTPDLPTCLKKRGVPFIARWNTITDADTSKLSGHFYSLAMPTIDGGLLAALDAFKARGVYTKTAKVGILHLDSPNENAAAKTVAAKVRALGGTVVADAGLTDPTQASSAVLKFRQAGVNVVHSLISGGSIAFFMINAETQGYRPQYALTSIDVITPLKSLVSPKQLSGAVAEGWQPIVDVELAQYPRNSASTACFNIYKSKGVTFNDGNAAGFALAVCDTLWFTRAAVTASGGNLVSAASVVAGAHTLGTTYVSASTIATDLRGDRDYAPSAMRDLAYNGGTKNWDFVSSTLRPLP